MDLQFSLDEHPLLSTTWFVAEWPKPLGEIVSPDWLTEQLRLDAEAPMQRDEAVRKAVRDMMRYGGYKPTGRGKPASEYLVRTAERGYLGPINAAVDVCNVVSLHSGLPISVVDADLVQPPLRIGIAPPDSRYRFNTAGQEINVSGLVVLFDQRGACANGVKDSQRTKTHDATRRTLTIIWGTQAFPERTEATVQWYKDVLKRLGCSV